MFAVIFEVEPKRERWDEYLAIAKRLRPEIERIDGFIDNERFRSRRRETRILSLSTWRDEKALVRWRTLGLHHEAQEKGRFEIFADYHLRVGEISADTAGASTVLPQQRLDATEIGAAKAVTISELDPVDAQPATADLAAALGLPQDGTSAAVEHEVFESLYNPGKLLLLAGWRDAEAAASWRPAAPPKGRLRHRQIRIIRDYGMQDRRVLSPGAVSSDGGIAQPAPPSPSDLYVRSLARLPEV